MAVKKRIIVAGLGSIGMRHARLLQEREDVQVELLEINKDILAAAKRILGDVKHYESFETALESKPDIVWLATPTPLHAAQSIQALQKGIHVFCEKPMTATLAEAHEVQNWVDKTGLIFNVGFYLHFWKGMQLLKALINDNKLGKILHIYARVGTYITLVNSLSRYQAHHPGSLFFDYAHQVDLVYWLLQQKPVSTFVSGFSGGNMEHSSSPNIADIILQFNDSVRAHIHLNYVQMPQRHEYEIVGDEGWAILDYEQSNLKIGYKQSQKIETISFKQDRDDIFREEHAAFIRAVDGNSNPETSAADGLVSTAICEAIMQSWKSGDKVNLIF